MNTSRDKITSGACNTAVIAALLYGVVPEVRYWPRAIIRPHVEVPASLPAVSIHPLEGPARDSRLLSLSRRQSKDQETQVGDEVTD